MLARRNVATGGVRSDARDFSAVQLFFHFSLPLLSYIASGSVGLFRYTEFGIRVIFRARDCAQIDS
jgi:hypothetical protein